MLDENTFGETPGAMYLARVLNQLDDRSYSRSVAKRINSTGEQVNDLVYAYQNGMPARTVANAFRLMRLEVTLEHVDGERSMYALADQLRRNVQIGSIKRGMRMTAIARKAEKIMENPEKRALKQHSTEFPEITEYHFTDRQSGLRIPAGYSIEGIRIGHTMDWRDVGDKTAELLVIRSQARCTRLRKPHTLVAS